MTVLNNIKIEDEKAIRYLKRKNYTQKELSTLISELLLKEAIKTDKLLKKHKKGEISIKEVSQELNMSEDTILNLIKSDFKIDSEN